FYPRAHASRKIDQLLSVGQRPHSTFGRLLGHASLRDAWTAQLRAFLPADLSSACEVANVRDHLLAVHIQNAAWATRFRFLIPELIPRLNLLADFADVREIQIKVSPTIGPASSSGASGTHRPADRAPPAADVLTAFADSLEYGPLKSAILRLARQGKSPGRAEKEAVEPSADGGL
ncbi:MAG: DUF721 domain-containing protein, partial [Gammaproteobacteria bacterium]|nr:DUF721 domain-containing protein [Gammaproteobacteria bacterium]